MDNEREIVHPVEQTNQAYGDCCVNGCDNLGRNALSPYITLAWGLNLTYCAKHRKYGMRVYKTLLRDYLRSQQESFRDEIEQNLPILSDESKIIMNNFFGSRVNRMVELEELSSHVGEIINHAENVFGSLSGSGLA